MNPTLESKARIKQLRGNVFPPYRMRVGDYRVFDDVEADARVVMIYGVVSKAQARQWLTALAQEQSDEDDTPR